MTRSHSYRRPRNFLLAFSTVGALVLAALALENFGSTASDVRLEVGATQESGIAPVEGLPPLVAPAVALTSSSELLVYGGRTTATDSTYSADGHVLDVSSGTGRRTADGPLGHLYDPAAATRGGKALVIGPACDEIVRDAETRIAGCNDGEYRAAIYDPAEDSWQQIELPSIIFDRYKRISPDIYRTTRVLSPTDSSVATFLVGDFGSEEVVQYSFETQDWKTLGGVPGSLGYCATSDRVVALTSQFLSAGQVVDFNPTMPPDPSTPPSSTSGSMDDGHILPRLHVYDPESQAWTTGEAIDGPKFSLIPRVGCMSSAAAVFGTLPGEPIANYDLNGGTWSSLLVPEWAFGQGSIVWTGQVLIALPGSLQAGAPVPAYTPGTHTLHLATDLPWSTPGALWNGEEAIGFSGAEGALLVPTEGRPTVMSVALPPGVFRIPREALEVQQ